MSCDRIQDNLSAYIDGEAGPELTAEIDRHLGRCQRCQRLLDELRSVSAVLNSMPQHAAPPTLAEDLQIRLERQMLIEGEGESSETAPAVADRRLARQRPSAWPRAIAVAACLLLVVGIAVLMKLPQRKEAVPAEPPEVLKSSPLAAVHETVGRGESVAGSVGSGRPTRGKKAGSFNYEAKETKSLSSTGDSGWKKSTERSDRDAIELGSRTPTGTGGGETPSGKAIRLADRKNNTPALEIAAGAQLKPRGPGKGPASRLRKRSSPAKAMVAGDNNLFLVTADGAAAEKELDVVLEQAGIVNAKRWSEKVEPADLAEARRHNRNLPSPETVAANEQVEVITVEANVNAEQFAALNLAVANNDLLEVQDTSDGVFAATAATQRVMLQVPRKVRLRELAGNRMIQSNLSLAAARRTREDRFQGDLSDGLLQRQPEAAATPGEKAEPAPKAVTSTEKLTLAKLEDSKRLRKVRSFRRQAAEQESEGLPTDKVAETPGDTDQEDDGRKSPAERAEEQRAGEGSDIDDYAAGKFKGAINNKKETEAAETSSPPAAQEAAKKDRSEKAAEPVAPREPPGRPAVKVAAESKPAKPPAGDEGKSAPAVATLAEKLPATQERIATGGPAEGGPSLRPSGVATTVGPTRQAATPTSKDDLAQEQVTKALDGLRARPESGETLIPIMIQIVARRALPPEVGADKSDAESAGKAGAGDRQLGTRSEAATRP